MAIYAGLRGWRLHEVPVVELARVTRRQRFGGARLWRGVFRTLQQSRRFARRLRQRSPRR
jgi:hypothetical protein